MMAIYMAIIIGFAGQDGKQSAAPGGVSQVLVGDRDSV